MHALQEFFAEAIYHGVVGAHALLHDFWSDADHVGVADVAALDDRDDIFAGAEFAFLRLHAEDAGIGAAEGVEDWLWGAGDRARREIFEEETFADGAALIQSSGQAGGYGLAGAIGDQGNAFAGLDRETGFDGVAGAGRSSGCAGPNASRYCKEGWAVLLWD